MTRLPCYWGDDEVPAAPDSTATSHKDEEDEEDEEEEAKPMYPENMTAADDHSERSSSIAEDDGTMYGKEFASDDEEELAETSVPPPPVFKDAAHQRIVSDSMNQKFIPPELRQPRPSIIDTSNIDVIRRSKLNLTEAENRIRHREPHLVFELLSKASQMYRHGVISSQELDALRALIVAKIQPSKMLIDMTMNMDGMISDHEWHMLILRAKAFIYPVVTQRSSDADEYLIRVVDVETGVIWFTRKRFKELYKLYRKLCRLSKRVDYCDFPPRRNPGRNSQVTIAHDRAPVLETFLRTAAALVTPAPLTFLNGCALKQLQQFLDIPHDTILERNRTQPVSRMLRAYVYHTINDPTSPEGKACTKFLGKMRQANVETCGDILEELGNILDGVQEYMLEHRFAEMRALLQRMVKYLSTMDAKQAANAGRKSSFVNLMSGDILTSNDKQQQLISDAIRHELEDKIWVPLMHDVKLWLKNKVVHKERQFRERIFQLKGKPQSYFGVPMDKISLSSWRTVIDSMKDLDEAFLPMDKMRKLVSTAHQIHTLYKSERHIFRSSNHDGQQSMVVNALTDAVPDSPQRGSVKSNADDQEDVLSGDDFLPIFIYIIVHCDLDAPIMTQVLLNRLCDPEKRRSESGYYLATFEAALHHILSFENFGDA
ncbi:TPA: hypothetical protein N0F65_004045 [Lagenidium giganteum]|uniref:VPS9 domain-containing protein n=1 Tax=Lagenidium giganteum TaxID=4803 RepID=A0AAV2YWG4_9STRA|nr:TPA: hypothetical protein N0F65_004045 [Lagenidium giganteum]